MFGLPAGSWLTTAAFSSLRRLTEMAEEGSWDAEEDEMERLRLLWLLFLYECMAERWLGWEWL